MRRMKGKVFVDTNVFLYLLSDNTDKKVTSKKILMSNPFISTQVLNEFSNISIKKFKLSIVDTKEILNIISEEATIFIFSQKTVFNALDLKEKYGFQFYDGLILATALENDCDTLYSEDMQHNQLIEKQLRIINPFK
jgi:predicted nucleic acid-binding protein